MLFERFAVRVLQAARSIEEARKLLSLNWHQVNALVNEAHLNEAFAEQFSELKQADLKVSRAWAIKARFHGFWGYRYAGWARRHFDKWYAWVIRCRLEPIKERARMLKNHLPHILTYFMHRINNAVAEGLNSKIQTVKANARGYRYRSFDALRNGGLDMTP